MSNFQIILNIREDTLLMCGVSLIDKGRYSTLRYSFTQDRIDTLRHTTISDFQDEDKYIPLSEKESHLALKKFSEIVKDLILEEKP